MLSLMVSRLSMYSRSKIDYSQLAQEASGEHTVRLAAWIHQTTRC